MALCATQLCHSFISHVSVAVCSCSSTEYAKEILPKVGLCENIWHILNMKMISNVTSKNSKDLSVCPDLLAQLSLL